ncbi:MAG: threonylcarbamoyl-AMP synthase [Deltaproteobacteria bacterium]|nr:threonylcarbamoyl-AMP synthase [Deltaproteobacteria bacterium]
MPITYSVDPAAPDEALLAEAAERLRVPGSVFIYPTETFYGLGARHSDTQALEKIFRIKGRDETKPLLLLIENKSWLSRLTDTVPAPADRLMTAFWPGPLTILFKASQKLSPLLTGTTGTVGCRHSGNPVAQKLLDFAGEPVTSTSANLAGGPNPVSIDDMPESLLSSVDIIIDAGPTAGGMPSTVLDASQASCPVVRQGAVTDDAIRCCLSDVSCPE